MSAEILIIDDNPDIRLILKDLIDEAGFKTRVAANYNQALSEIDKKLPDVAIIDVKLDKGDNDGIELLSHIKKKNKDIPVIIISGHANIEMAVKSLKSGAFEFIQKPFDQERLMNFVNRAVENYNLKNENKSLQKQLFHSFELIGSSQNIEEIKDQISKLSSSESRIFINGPTGSGKELIARKIHKISNRKKGPFIILNGALLDVRKYELELFGEEKSNGSISYGALEKSSGGILLIDEVSEIPLETQSKILRVLIDQKFKRINGNHDIKVDVRIICSTNKNISSEIKNGNFREDLFHRLNVFSITIEPLSKRLEDVPLLIEYFSKKISNNYNLKEFDLKPYINYLINYNWPGNVRELRNLIERIAILSPGNSNEKILNIIKESIKTSKSESYDSNHILSFPLKEARENFEKDYLTTQLKKFGGNISKTAKFVGMERSALHRKLKMLGVKGLN
ncbi:sigma-54 dependent transcriptional regulator [Candidatus Pelagibacter sp.]|nr:sigma-54 dependent transcriptional regulator [Candidatus Pelagibacter sp.]